MSNFQNRIGIYLIALGMVGLVTGCTHKNSAPNPQSPQGDTGPSYFGASSSNSDLSGPVLDHVHCRNPIRLDSATLTPVDGPDNAPKGRWNLRSLELYEVSESDNASFTIAGNAINGFNPVVRCNGLRDRRDRNHRWHNHFRRRDRAADRDQTIFRRAYDSISASFAAATWINTRTHTASSTEERIYAQFGNGALRSAIASLQPNQNSTNMNSYLDQGPIRHVQMGPDMFLSARMYRLDWRRLELRIKLEYPADQNGNRTIQYGQIVYARDRR